MNLLNNKIKLIRETLNLSQREFGKKIGVSRDVISNIEYSRVQPKELLLQHICECYGVNEEWLKNGKGEMFKSDPVEEGKLDKALKIFKSLQPEFQDYALEQIQKLVDLQNKTTNEKPKAD